MKRWVRFGLTITLENEPYKGIVKTRPVGTVDSEFAACFRACMLYAPQLIQKFGLDNDPHVDFVIEDGHRNLQEAVQLFEVAQQCDATLNRQLRSINKAEKEKFVGTQLADLLAYFSYKEACKYVAHRIILPAPTIFEELLKGAPVHHYYFNEVELVTIKLSVVADWTRVKLPRPSRR